MRESEKFYLDEYLKQGKSSEMSLQSMEEKEKEFKQLCETIYKDFYAEWESEKESAKTILDTQKKAIIGHENEVAYFKEKIRTLLLEHNAYHCYYPSYYLTLEEAIYHENWGLSGVSQWFHEEYMKNSSSAKVIGDRIYFMEGGRMVLKKQKITRNRKDQLVRALLLLTPQERFDKDFHEVYMLDGTRITIYNQQLTKIGQDAIIFRRYIIPEYSFKEQIVRHTIPENSEALFQSMVRIGFNVAMTGAIRSSKTTFLSTWQSCENQELEGVMIETDPEIPMHKMMPKAPIIQIVADNEKLSSVSKILLRSDGDYFVIAEARDGNALDLGVRIASKGTRRMKMTFHSSDPLDFCYDVAVEILRVQKLDLYHCIRKVAKSFQYIFHFVQLRDKSQKRLKGIYEICLDNECNEIRIVEICKYNYKSDSWGWRYHVGYDKEVIGEEEDENALMLFKRELKRLAEKSFLAGDGIYRPYYGSR